MQNLPKTLYWVTKGGVISEGIFNLVPSSEIESDNYEEAEENYMNFENEKNTVNSQVNVMCEICHKPYIGLLKVG